MNHTIENAVMLSESSAEKKRSQSVIRSLELWRIIKMLRGKKVIIFGVANDKSIAWAIARLFHEQGAELAITYAGEAFEKRVRPLAESIDAAAILPCNVTSDD